MNKKKHSTILFSIFLSVFLTSCALTGAYVFERFDRYIADYFKNFAEFSDEQKTEIDKFSREYQLWLVTNRFSAIRGLLVRLKELDLERDNNLISDIDTELSNLWSETGKYFIPSFTEFSKTLNSSQVIEIEDYFKSLETKENLNKKRSQVEFQDQILERYKKGFKRLNIKLNDRQIEIIKSGANKTIDILEEWRLQRQNWTYTLIDILKKRNQPKFDEYLKNHFYSQLEMGSENYKNKLDQNKKVTINTIEQIFKSLTPEQRRRFEKRINLYLSIIDKILIKELQ